MKNLEECVKMKIKKVKTKEEKFKLKLKNLISFGLKSFFNQKNVPNKELIAIDDLVLIWAKLNKKTMRKSYSEDFNLWFNPKDKKCLIQNI